MVLNNLFSYDFTKHQHGELDPNLRVHTFSAGVS